MNENQTPGNKSGLFEILNAKSAFWLGFVSALGVVFAIGFIIMGYLMLTSDDTTAKAATTNTAAAANVNTAGTLPTAANITIPAVTDADYIRGDKKAKVTVVEYTDMECPYCKRFHTTMQQIVNDYAGKVNWVQRHFPLEQLHPNAPKLAQASECVAEQKGNDGFWAFSDKVYGTSSSFDMTQVVATAVSVGADKAKFETCYNSTKFTDKIAKETQDAVNAGGQGTPYSVIIAGDKRIPVSGAYPVAQMKQIIDSAL